MSKGSATNWVDETTGFTRREQDALIHYLLALHDKDE